MRSIAHRVILASGWSRRLIAVAAGAVGALAMAPIAFFPACFVPMTVAVWLIDGAVEGRRQVSFASLRSAFGAGFWWSLGYFVAGMWWLGSAFLFEPEKWAWAMPFGVIGFPGLLALFPALGFALARCLWSPGSGRILALAAGLGISEYLRATTFTGFPWNEYGMALGNNLVLAQAASLIGVHGLTVVAVAVFAAPAALTAEPGRRRRLPLPVALAALVLAGFAAYGALRLKGANPGAVAGVHVRIMQPNVVQDAEFRASNKDAILSTYLTLSDRSKSPTHNGLADVTHLIWPETSLPTILARDPQTLERIGAALPAGTTLIAGAFRIGDPVGDDPIPRYYNSVQVVRSGGQIIDSYDKVHLVPFGEYMPWFLARLGVEKFVKIPGSFEAGVVRKLLTVPGLPPVSPLICYEAIFSGEVTPRSAAVRPGVLLNVSNDSWFGTTFGPWQHLSHARLRTIEEGLPMIRAATTGVSAVIDPYGRVVARLPVAVADVLDADLPKAIDETFFSRHGFAAMLVLWALAMVGALVFRRPA